MTMRLALVALNQQELAALVSLLLAARAQWPWRMLALRADAGAWVLHLVAEPGLYAHIQAQRAVPPAKVHGESSLSSARTESDCLAQWMSQAVLPWPPSASGSKSASNSANKSSDALSSNSVGKPVRKNVGKSGGKPVAKFAGQDLRGKSFAGQDLRGADFGAADLRGTDFSAANLQGANLQGARLGMPDALAMRQKWRLPAYRLLLNQGAVFALLALVLLALVLALGFCLGYAAASVAGFVCCVLLLWLDQQYPRLRQALANGGTRFDAANLQHADFSRAQIGLSNFEQAQLQQVCWRGVKWQVPLYFSDAALRVDGVPALLAGSAQGRDFSAMDLSGLNFSNLDLAGLDFSHANLQGANLSDCNMQDCKLAHADLRQADLSRANLSGADLSAWQIDSQTVLEQIGCTHWHANHLDGGRCPPAPAWLRPGEFVHLLPTTCGIRFVASDLAQLKVHFDVIMQLAKTLPVRISRILFEADPAQYGCVGCVGLSHGDAETDEGGAAGYLIEMQLDAGVDTQSLCRSIWQRVQQRVQQRAQQAADNDSLLPDRLLTLLATLAQGRSS